jgi:hypothetical protein
VLHVDVNESGQAIVGNVESWGRVRFPRELCIRRRHNAERGHFRGSSCQSSAMPNGRCGIHGEPSPGHRKGSIAAPEFVGLSAIEGLTQS